MNIENSQTVYVHWNKILEKCKSKFSLNEGNIVYMFQNKFIL